MSVNKATILGNLGKDPKVTTLNSGGRVVTFSIATSEKWKDKTTGEARERTQWHNIVVYNEPIGKIAETYLRKGSQVYLEGAIETRKYTDQAGAERYVTEIVLRPFNGLINLIGGAERGDRAPPPGEDPGRRAPASLTSSGGGEAFHDDDIPF